MTTNDESTRARVNTLARPHSFASVPIASVVANARDVDEAVDRRARVHRYIASSWASAVRARGVGDSIGSIHRFARVWSEGISCRSVARRSLGRARTARDRALASR